MAAKKITNQRQAIEAIKAYAQRQGAIGLFDSCFPKQLAFIEDKNYFKAALCNRRAGKSMACGLMLFETALRSPGVDCTYIGLTRLSAKRGMFHNVLEKINNKFKLGAIPNLAELSFTLPNGSKIYCIGADSNAMDSEKLRGMRNAICIIDECQSYSIDLRYLVNDILGHTLTDFNGQMVLIGTPGNLINRTRKYNPHNQADKIEKKMQTGTVNDKYYFYNITEGLETGWAVHKWSSLDNTSRPDPKGATIAENEANRRARLIAQNPLIIHTPSWKRETLGEWYQDSDSLIYSGFDEKKNVITIDQFNEIKKAQKDHPTYLMGLDWGNASAILIACYFDTIDALFFLEAYKKQGLTIDDMERKIKDYSNKYQISKYITDHSKQTILTLKSRMQINFTNADKTDKPFHIDIMNDEFILEKIKLVVSPTTNDSTEEDGIREYISELQENIWNPKMLPDRVKMENADDHLSDCGIYIQRYSKHYLAKYNEPQEEKPYYNMDEEMRRYWDRQFERNKEGKGEDILAGMFDNNGDDFY